MIYLKKSWLESLPLWIYFCTIIWIAAISYSVYIYYIWIPIQKISNAITQLTIHWKKFKKIKINRVDDIWIIAHFINQVIDKVKKHSDELIKWRRVIGEVNTASEIQKSILPKTVPEWVIGLDVVARSKASSEVWWDSFDVISSWDDDTLFYIWDVTGHWVPAALVMTMVNAAFRSFATSWLNPKEIFSKVNDLLLLKIKTNHFMSTVMLRWDNRTQKMHYTGAWHETILHYVKKTWKVKNIKSGWIALKMVENISKFTQEKEIDFQSGDTLFLYSDWITEAKNELWERYWVNRIIKVLEQHWVDSSKNIFKVFTKDFSSYVWNAEQRDDATVIILNNIWQYWTEANIDLWISSSDDSDWDKKWWSWD